MSIADDIAKVLVAYEFASDGPAELGIATQDMPPGEWFAENASHGSGDIHTVWLPKHPLTRGEYPRPEHAVILAITGNGPQSEANALAIAAYWEAAPRLAAWAQQVMPLVEAAEQLKEAEPGRMTPKWMSRYQDAVTKLIAAALALNLEVE